MTALGKQLTVLPIDPRLVKMVLVAVVLKCLDPVVTIVSCLSSDDPFIIPISPDQRRKALERRYDLVADSCSDHLALIKAFQLWDKAGGDPLQKKVFYNIDTEINELLLVSFIQLRSLSFHF